MTNRINSFLVSTWRLDLAEAEVWIGVRPEHLTSTTQARARLTGPCCAYSTTIEVAYRAPEPSREGIPYTDLRIIIPEPNLWDPVSPFLYHGVLELWQDGQCCDQVQFTHGLRTLQLSPRGFVWNGKALTIRGTQCQQLTEPEARRLRGQGCNALVVSATTTPDTWDLADKLGFLVLGRITGRNEIARASDLTSHPCCLGWLLASDLLKDELVREALLFPPDPGALHKQGRGQLTGVELTQASTEPLPKEIAFVVCDEKLPGLENIPQPKILLTKDWPATDAPAGILGWIVTP